MAGIAVGWNRSVVVVDVAARASHGRMEPGQRKNRVVVVKGRRGPGRCGVAQLALQREPGDHVIRVGCRVEILRVARRAARVGDVVIAVDVALRALQRDVRSGERKARGAVIECCARPRDGAVARVAGRREASLHVIRVGRGLKILHVAGRAGGGGQVVVAVHMALRAWQRGVSSGQREPSRCVIEGGSGPRDGGVAALADLREPDLGVVRVSGSLVVLQVAGDACRARQIEVSVGVA